MLVMTSTTPARARPSARWPRSRPASASSNTRARLAHQFGARFRFEFQRHRDGFTVLVAIPVPSGPRRGSIGRVRGLKDSDAIECPHKTIRDADRRRRAARARADAHAARTRDRRRGRRRSARRRRGRRRDPRAVARPRVSRRADAEARRLRGDPDGRRRADAGGRLRHRLRSARAARVRGPGARLPAQAVRRRPVPGRAQARPPPARQPGDRRSRPAPARARPRPEDRSSDANRPARRQIRRPAVLPPRRRDRLDRSGRQLRPAARRRRRRICCARR